MQIMTLKTKIQLPYCLVAKQMYAGALEKFKIIKPNARQLKRVDKILDRVFQVAIIKFHFSSIPNYRQEEKNTKHLG